MPDYEIIGSGDYRITGSGDYRITMPNGSIVPTMREMTEEKQASRLSEIITNAGVEDLRQLSSGTAYIPLSDPSAAIRDAIRKLHTQKLDSGDPMDEVDTLSFHPSDYAVVIDYLRKQSGDWVPRVEFDGPVTGYGLFGIKLKTSELVPRGIIMMLNRKGDFMGTMRLWSPPKRRDTKYCTIVTFESQYQLMYYMLRFQEYYESPKFAGTVFTRAEFEAWYKPRNGSYYLDWNGTNFPKRVYVEFMQRFNPWEPCEQDLINLIANPKPYIVGVHTGNGEAELQEALLHEQAHAVYSCNDVYRRAVRRFFRMPEIAAQALRRMGYGEHVLFDEYIAFSIAGPRCFPGVARNRARLRRLLQKYL